MHNYPFQSIVPDGARYETGPANQIDASMSAARLRQPDQAPRAYRHRPAMVMIEVDDFAFLALASIVIGFITLCIVGLCFWIYCAPVESFDWVPKLMARV